MTDLPGGGLPGEVPHFRPPAGPILFRRRAGRLAALGQGHAAGDYLAFLARLAAAQADAAARLRLSPNGRDLPPGRPLDVRGPPPPEWRDALGAIASALGDAPMPGPAREALAALGRLGTPGLDSLAARVLDGALGPGDLAPAPFVGAALQVAYGGLAAGLPPGAVARAGDAGCPACGFAPVAGAVLGNDKLRYLVCGLCGSEWHLTRLQCAVCRSAERVSYLALEGHPGPAKAEICDGCMVYTKLLYVESDPALEPFADDLASLALDLLVAERGYARNGRSLFLATAAEG
jgi:FdhE protein